jgi:ABC-type antimicrobial peptide transport system permease subunit
MPGIPTATKRPRSSGIKPANPMTFASVSALLLIVAFLGCYFPARRGSRMNPVDALRSE